MIICHCCGGARQWHLLARKGHVAFWTSTTTCVCHTKAGASRVAYCKGWCGDYRPERLAYRALCLARYTAGWWAQMVSTSGQPGASTGQEVQHENGSED